MSKEIFQKFFDKIGGSKLGVHFYIDERFLNGVEDINEKNTVSGTCKEILVRRKRFNEKSFQLPLGFGNAHILFCFHGDFRNSIEKTFKQFSEDPIETFLINDNAEGKVCTLVFLRNSHFFNSDPVLLDFFVIVIRCVVKAGKFINKSKIIEIVESMKWFGVSYDCKLFRKAVKSFKKFVKIFTKEENKPFVSIGIVSLSLQIEIGKAPVYDSKKNQFDVVKAPQDMVEFLQD